MTIKASAASLELGKIEDFEGYEAGSAVNGQGRWKDWLLPGGPLVNSTASIDGTKDLIFSASAADGRIFTMYDMTDYDGRLEDIFEFTYTLKIDSLTSGSLMMGAGYSSYGTTPFLLVCNASQTGEYPVSLLSIESGTHSTDISLTAGVAYEVKMEFDVLNKTVSLSILDTEYSAAEPMTYELSNAFSDSIINITGGDGGFCIFTGSATAVNAQIDNFSVSKYDDSSSEDPELGKIEDFEGYEAGSAVNGQGRWEDWLLPGGPLVNSTASIDGTKDLVFSASAADGRIFTMYDMTDYDGRLEDIFEFTYTLKIDSLTSGSLMMGAGYSSYGTTPFLLVCNASQTGEYPVSLFGTEATTHSTGISLAAGVAYEVKMEFDVFNKTVSLSILDTENPAAEPMTYKLSDAFSDSIINITGGDGGFCIFTGSATAVNAQIDNFSLSKYGVESIYVSSKTASYLYPSSFVDQAVSNAAQYEWAVEIRDIIVDDASYWRDLSYNELWDKMIQPGMGPRSLMVWSDGYCPDCDHAVGLYDWECDKDWKVSCPYCHEKFPKNDYKAFYESGIDPQTGVFSYAAADKSLLYNTEHPDPSDPLHMYGVDDGHGYNDGTHTWYFVGYYQYWGAWFNDILEGIKRLSAAYTVTGDIEYARRAAILLDHTADYFPEFDYSSQGLVYERTGTAGYISYCVDSAYDVRYLAEAYDQIFDAIKGDDVLVEFLSDKAALYPDNEVYSQNDKSSFSDIQQNIETRIFRHALSHLNRLETNFPGPELTVAIINTILSWETERDQILADIEEIAEQATAVDGVTGEKGLANYTAFPIRNIALLMAKYAAIDEDFLPDLIDKVPNLKKTWRFFIDTWCLNSYYPHSGDSGWFAQKEDSGWIMQEDASYIGMQLWKPGRSIENIDCYAITPLPSLYTFLWRLYEVTGDEAYAKLMYVDNGRSVEGLPYDILSGDYETIQQGVSDVIAEYGDDLSTGSVNKTEYHIALMRRNDDTSPVFWLDYDSSASWEHSYGGHSQLDGMNLGLYGYGLDLMTDFGYPPVNKDGGWQGPYTTWYTKTLSHNTVVVNGSYQNAADGQTDLWLDGDTFRAVRARGESMYSNTTRYERTVAMSDITEDDSYIIDVFRVAGGSRHDRFMSTQYAGLTTSGLELSPVTNPWSTVAITNVMSDPEPAEGWSADFSIEDYYGYLEDGADIHVKYTDLTKEAAAYTMNAWTEIGFDNPVERDIPRIATTRTGSSGLQSTFVGVIEPYDTDSKISSIKCLELTDVDGNQLSDSFVAVEIELTTGVTELVILNDPDTSVEGGFIYQEDWKVRTDREICVLSKGPDGAVTIKEETGGTATVLDTAPVLTAGAVNRTSDTEATVRFTSDKAGQYYYAVVEEGSDEPFIDTSGTGTVCAAGETTITNPAGMSAGAKDIYVKVKDASGNVSGALKMDIDAYTSEGKPFIISSDGVLDRTEGIKAVADVELVPGTDTHAGNEVVVFELMKGSTPVSIIAVEKDIASKETFTAYFNVDDPQNGAYTVRVFVLDTFDSDMTAPISLAEPADLD